jgi:hypothetical protein
MAETPFDFVELARLKRRGETPLEIEGTSERFAAAPFWRDMDPVVLGRQESNRIAVHAERLARQEWLIATLPEDERPTERDPHNPEFLRQSWVEAARTSARLDPEGEAIWEARERHFIETGSDEPWAPFRVHHYRPRRTRPARPAPAAAAPDHPAPPAKPSRHRRG